MAGEFHKGIAIVKEHPLLFSCIAAVVVIYFLWPSGTSSSGTSDLTSQEVAAISDASQANASLTLAQDQVQVAGAQIAGNVAMNAANDSTQYSLGALQANVDSLNSNNELSAFDYGTAYNTADIASNNATALNELADQNATVFASQNSAQSFISALENEGLQSPATSVLGGQFSGTGATPATTISLSSLNNLFPIQQIGTPFSHSPGPGTGTGTGPGGSDGSGTAGAASGASTGGSASF